MKRVKQLKAVACILAILAMLCMANIENSMWYMAPIAILLFSAMKTYDMSETLLFNNLYEGTGND